jgi:hypothetical protein
MTRIPGATFRSAVPQFLGSSVPRSKLPAELTVRLGAFITFARGMTRGDSGEDDSVGSLLVIARATPVTRSRSVFVTTTALTRTDCEDHSSVLGPNYAQKHVVRRFRAAP